MLTGSRVLLMILDGWGVSSQTEYSAMARANLPNMSRLQKDYPYVSLECSGEAVGLPEGQMGNSEVGHLNIGAGRVVYQDFARIDKSIRKGDFFENPVLRGAVEQALSRGSALHLIGLLSDGGVHSHLRHVLALLKMAASAGLERVFVHAMLDGRDVPPSSGSAYIAELEQQMASIGVGRLATVMGRYYGMDRDRRWDRVSLAWQALVEGKGLKAETAMQAVLSSYERGQTDEFVKPAVITENGLPIARVSDGDAVIFFNFRPDRARQISQAFNCSSFDGFQRRLPENLHYVCMTRYDDSIEAAIAFPPQDIGNTLAEHLSAMGLRQLHIAETEKYAHVTFFFNGGIEEPFAGEDRFLVPSPQVPTYDLQPVMSAPELTKELLPRLEEGSYDFVVLNFANADMVGHTGIMEAAVEAVEAVDHCVGKIVESAVASGYKVIITADHGNAEQMIDPSDGQPFTAHTSNDVPFILVDESRPQLRRDGILADIAPTVLELMGLTKPVEMSGQSLLV